MDKSNQKKVKFCTEEHQLLTQAKHQFDTLDSALFSTPKLKNTIQILKSPKSPRFTDLFSQLLGPEITPFCKSIPSNSKLQIEDDLELDSFLQDQNSSNQRELIKKRRRKTNVQLKMLRNQYQKDKVWGKDKITKMSKITGLTQSQVYKWCWDQKKKLCSDQQQLLSKQQQKCIQVCKKIKKSKTKKKQQKSYLDRQNIGKRLYFY